MAVLEEVTFSIDEFKGDLNDCILIIIDFVYAA